MMTTPTYLKLVLKKGNAKLEKPDQGIYIEKFEMVVSEYVPQISIDFAIGDAPDQNYLE